MSHEGIRITTQAEGTGDEEAPLSSAAVTPQKVRIKKTEGTGVEIDWKDGHKSAWSFKWLRNACPCATCHEEREQNHRPVGVPRPHPPTLLPLYEAPVRPTEVDPVGKYALKFKWSDGHQSGIYSWDYLRRVCQCPQCAPEKVTK